MKITNLICLLSLIISMKVYSVPSRRDLDTYRAAASDAKTDVDERSNIKLPDGIIDDSDYKALGELISSGEKSGGNLISKATNLSDHFVSNISSAFSPDKLLMGAFATSAGLTLGGLVIDGITSGADQILGRVLQKLSEDVEKINYELFYKELAKLEQSLEDLEKLSKTTEKMKKLNALKGKIKPAFSQTIKQSDVDQFITNTVCSNSLSILGRAKMKSDLKNIINIMKDSSSFDRKLCFNLSMVDELKSRVNSANRILSIKFNDMKQYRLRKVENEANAEFLAWEDRINDHNSYIDAYRNEALSCLSNPEKTRGTQLENLFKNEKLLKISGGKFNFKKVWNKLFTAKDIASDHGFHYANTQREFKDSLTEIASSMSCDGQYFGGLSECIRQITNSEVIFVDDTMALKSLLEMKSKQLNGGKLTHHQEQVISALEIVLEQEDLSFISNPFGNMILASGPKSINRDTTFHSTHETKLRSSDRPFNLGHKGLSKINDISNLSCGHDYITDKVLCNQMLVGMKESMENGCAANFSHNDINKKAIAKLNDERLQRESNINVAIIDEKTKLRKIERFVNSYGSPIEGGLHSRLDAIAQSYDSFIDSGYCSRK